jgi:hypothetical protein
MKSLFILIATVVNLVAFSAGYIQPNQTNNTAQSSKDVDYRGVSLQFDQALAREIKAETVPASLSGKPSDLWPEHVAFSLAGYPRPHALPDDFQIRVFSIKHFREAVETGYREYAQTAIVRPGDSWTNDFDEEVRVLKALLAAKPAPTTVQNFLKRTRKKGDFNKGMPFLPMWEAQQAFISNVKYVNFRNGKGVFFLTQWDIETSQIANDGLEYAFQGITADGKYYVYAEFSVSAPKLPSGTEPTVIAWNEKNYLLPRQSKKYQDYVRPVVSQLQALRGDEFKPKLELLEQLISSLNVQIQ